MMWTGQFGRVLPLFLALTLTLATRPAVGETMEAAKALEDQGNWQQAHTVYRTLYDQGDRHYPVLYNLARLTAWKGNLATAKTLYVAAYGAGQTQEERMWSQFGLAELAAWERHYDEAAAFYRAWVTAMPQIPEPRYRLAQVETWARRLPMALKLYQENLVHFPTHLPSRLGEIEIYAWQGRYRKALRLYEAFLETHADQPDVWIGYAKTLAWHGELLKSLKTIKTAKERFPSHQAVEQTLIWVQAQVDGVDTFAVKNAQEGLSGVEALQQTGRMTDGEHSLELRPILQSTYASHNEAGTVDEKVLFQKLTNSLTFFPRQDSRVWLTADPVFYASGGGLARERRYTYGLGGARQWDPHLRTSGWVGLADFSNDGPMALLTQLTVSTRLTDWWQPSLAYSRDMVEDSLLSATGLRPQVGIFANRMVGRVVRNEWTLQNLFRLPYSVQGTLRTAMGFDEGQQIDDNTFWRLEYGLKRDLFKFVVPHWLSTWYGQYQGQHWHFEDDRLNNGGAFLLVKQFGLPLGSDTASPFPSPGNPGTGGYFSPDRYVFQGAYLGNRGEIGFHRLFYDVSAFAGYQDISRFGGNLAWGVQCQGELRITRTLASIFGYFFNQAQPFDQSTFYVGLKKRL